MQSRGLRPNGHVGMRRTLTPQRRGDRGPGRTAGFTVSAMALAGILLVLSCGDGAVEPAPPPLAPVATTVTVSPASATLIALGETARLTAEVRDQNGQVMAEATIAWASSDAAVAAVDASGQVTAAANGSATITATVGSVSGTATVTVAQVVSAVTVTPAADTLVAFGDTVRLVAEATDANGHGVAGTEFLWESSDEGVAAVDGSGRVTAAGNGTATITATADDASGTAGVAVMQAPDSVAIVPSEATIAALGDTLRLRAEAFDANGHGVAGAQFLWESSDDAVAAVDGSGLVTAAGNGAATITASADGARGESAITVAANRAPAARDSIPSHTMILGNAASVQVTPFFSDPDGDVLSYSATSSDGQVLGVSVTGSALRVVALAPGTATVTVTATDPGGLSATQSTSVEGTTSILTAIQDMDAFLDECPENDPAYARIRQDFEVRRDDEVVTHPLVVCSEPVSEMPQENYWEMSYALQTFQSLRLAYYMNDGTEGRLPWTDKGLYDWMASNVAGVNYKTAPSYGYCCDVINGKLYISSPLTWLDGSETGPAIFPLIGYFALGTLAFLVHEARHADDDDPGHVGGCGLGPGACDATYDLTNLGGYGVHYWMHASWATGYLNVGIGCSERAVQYVEAAKWGANVLVRHFVTNPPPEVVPQPPHGGPCIPLDTPWK